jgi:hypothetical protein
LARGVYATRGRLELYQNHRGFGIDDPMNHIAIFTPTAHASAGFPKGDRYARRRDDILIECFCGKAAIRSSAFRSYDGAIRADRRGGQSVHCTGQPIYINDLVTVTDYR